MKPSRCTLSLSIFISTSLHVSGNYVPKLSGTDCIYVTLVFLHSVSVAVWSASWDETGWLSGLLVGMRLGGFLVCWLG